MRALPVFAAGAVYWILGALWYSTLFGKVWGAGLEAQGLKVPQPSGGQLAAKLILTFAANLAAAAALAMMLANIAPASPAAAIELGLIAAAGVAATSIGIAYTWEGKATSVYLVDAGYHLVGLPGCALILALWPR